MTNKRKKPEIVLEEAVRTFNRFVIDRDFEGARKYLQGKPESVKRAIIYNKDGWYGVLKCSSL